MFWRVPLTSRSSGALTTSGWRPSLQVGGWDDALVGTEGTGCGVKHYRQGNPLCSLVSIAWIRSRNCFSKELPLISVLNCYMFWEKPLVIFVFWMFDVSVTMKDWDLKMWYKDPFQ